MLTGASGATGAPKEFSIFLLMLPEQQVRSTLALGFPPTSSQDPLPVQQVGPQSLLPNLSPGFSDSLSDFAASGPVSVSSPYLFSFFWTFGHLRSGQSQKTSTRRTPNRNRNQSQSITGILCTRHLIGRYGRYSRYTFRNGFALALTTCLPSRPASSDVLCPEGHDRIVPSTPHAYLHGPCIPRSTSVPVGYIGPKIRLITDGG